MAIKKFFLKRSKIRHEYKSQRSYPFYKRYTNFFYIILYKHFRARSKTFSEFFWSAALFLFEDPVEVGDIIEAAVVRNFCNGMGGIDQFFGSMSQPDFIQAVNKCIACSLFYEPTEGNFRHIDQPGNFTERNCAVIIMIHDTEKLFQCVLLLELNCSLLKLALDKCAHIAGNGEIMQDRHQFQHGIKPIFFIQ